MKITRHLLLAALMSLCASAFAADRGYFGFSVAVDVDGFFDPTLRSARVAKVEPQSPAGKAGLREGDVIVEVESKVVAGAKAKELQALMRKDVGQQATFLVKRADGQLLTVALTAAAKPH